MGEGTEEWDITSPSLIVYKLNDSQEIFEKIQFGSIEDLHTHLVSDNVLLVIDIASQESYLWKGESTTIHMKFLAARIAPEVRDKHGTMALHTVDENSESVEFKTLLKLS